MNDRLKTPHSYATWAALFLAAVLPVLAWPGDVSWTNDEPRLLAAACHANQGGQLATGGLYGNFGLRYGPLPTQIYQTLLALTPDPVTLAMLRSALCAGVTAFSLLWLARLLRLPPWFAVALSVAPQVWQYQRVLWDASFTIPLSALALAATAAFFQRATRGRLLLAFGSLLLLPLIHPQALALAAAAGGGLLLRGYREMRRHWVALLILVTAIGAWHAVYFLEVAFALADRLGGAVRNGYPAAHSHTASVFAPLLGGTLFSEARFGGGVVPAEHLPVFWPVAAFLARVIYLLGWIGIAVAAGLAFRRPDDESAVRIMIARVALATLLLQALVFGLMRVPAEPQYFFGTFAVHALLPWLAVDALRWRRTGLFIGAAYGCAVAALTLGGMLAIHHHGYAPQPPRARLSEQVALVRALNAFSNTTALTDAALYQRYPQALRALRLLLPPSSESRQPAPEQLVIHGPPTHARLELVNEPAATASPTLTPLDLTSLPKGWQPPAESP